MPTIDRMFTHRPSVDSVPNTAKERRVVERANRLELRDGPIATASARAAAGAILGLVGGLLMLALMLPWTWQSGAGVLLPPKAIAATWFGLDSLLGGTAVVTVGFLTHFATAIGWGVLFGLTSHRHTSVGIALGGAMLYGIFVWLVMTWGLLPWLNETMAARVDMMSIVWFSSHLLYAAPLAAVPFLARAMSSRAVARAKRQPQHVGRRSIGPEPAADTI